MSLVLYIWAAIVGYLVEEVHKQLAQGGSVIVCWEERPSITDDCRNKSEMSLTCLALGLVTVHLKEPSGVVTKI